MAKDTFGSWFLCLYVPSAGPTSVCQHTRDVAAAGADTGLCALQVGTLPTRLLARALRTVSLYWASRLGLLQYDPEAVLQAEGFLLPRTSCLSVSLLAQFTPFLATYDTVSSSAFIE